MSLEIIGRPHSNRSVNPTKVGSFGGKPGGLRFTPCHTQLAITHSLMKLATIVILTCFGVQHTHFQLTQELYGLSGSIKAVNTTINFVHLSPPIEYKCSLAFVRGAPIRFIFIRIQSENLYWDLTDPRKIWYFCHTAAAVC